MKYKNVSKIVEEAARLLRENPSWTYKKAIERANEIYKGVK